MRDVHFDGSFMRDFSAATKQWSWATWHQIRAAQEATAVRLLEQVFDTSGDNANQADDSSDEPAL